MVDTTNGLPAVGTRYREVVQMLPFVRGEILSEITRYEPPSHLEERFWGAGMQATWHTSLCHAAGERRWYSVKPSCHSACSSWSDR